MHYHDEVTGKDIW